MSSLGDASARAHSRAAVYQAIEDAYGAKKFNSKSLTNETQSLSQNTVTNNAVNIILDAINDKTQKSRQFITEIINGKQIVLENVKTVRDLKSSSKAKSKSKRKPVASNKLLKKKGLCNPAYRPCNGDITLMHNMWWSYIKSVIKSCQSDVQLQARLHASEMVGARGIVLDAANSKLVGIKGIVTAVSGSCYYVAVDTIPNCTACSGLSDRENQLSVNVNKPRLGRILRLIKEQCNLGIILPPISRTTMSTSVESLSNSIKGDLSTSSTKTPIKSGANDGLKVDSTFSDEDEVKSCESDEDSSESEEASVDSADVTPVAMAEDYSYKVFDWNEKTEGVKLCVLYGKKYLPNCIYDNK